jgi:signal transduction histidine kinase
MFFTGVLVIALLLCQIVFNLFFSKPYLVDFKKSQADNLFKTIRNGYTDDFNTLYNMTKTAEDNNMNVLIFSDSGFIYSNKTMDSHMIRRMFIALNPVLNTVFSFDPEARVIDIPQTNLQVITLNGKFEYAEGNRYVIIESPVESISTIVQLLSRANVMIFSIALIVGLTCAFIFSRRFSKPIINIMAVAQNVANLKFDVKADENLEIIELSDLSASINTMAEKLIILIADLQRKNRKLQFDIEHQLRLDKMRREFVANVSHELKTPLCLLMLYSENLKNNVDSIDKDFYCDTIIDEVRKLDEMAKSLLDLSAIEYGLSAMTLEKFDFSALLSEIVAGMALMYKELNAAVQIEEKLYVTGDGSFLEQAVKNYIVNGISHTKHGGNIDIILRSEENSVVFSVSNEGKNIAPEDMDQIWESFYKTDKARIRGDETHSGLGLYIVKTIINAHDGEYGIQNHENGVEFWFSIPKAIKSGETEEPEKTPLF